MKRTIFFFLFILFTLTFSRCEYFENNDELNPDDTTTVLPDTSDYITYQFIHEADSVYIVGEGYIKFHTLYLMKLEHTGYFNDWVRDYLNNRWIYDTTNYLKISKGETKYWSYHKDSIPMDTYWNVPITTLRMGFIYPNNDLWVWSNQIDSTRAEYKTDTIVIKLSKFVPQH